MMTAPKILGKRLGELLRGLYKVPPSADLEVSSLVLDSRKVTQGSLFLALSGHQTHGLEFAKEAVRQGAVAVVYEPVAEHSDDLVSELNVPVFSVTDLSSKTSLIAARFYDDPSRDMFTVGITGTDGKTSCSHFMAQALQKVGLPCGVIGTLGYGLLGDLHEALNTTPDPVTLQQELADVAQLGAKAVTMEVSSHALAQARAAAVHFDVAVLTNLGRDHLDYHGNLEAYASAKRKLFECEGLKAAVLNVDDAFGRELMDMLIGRVQRVAYSLDLKQVQALKAEHWVAARSVNMTSLGLELEIESSWGKGVVQTGLMGHFNASNLMATLAVLLVKGMILPDALVALSAVQPVAGRMDKIGGDGQPLVVIDYAHTPMALEQVLLALRPHCKEQLWCVFGAGGDRDAGKRPLMGEVVERLADHVWITDDNPRYEDSTAIVMDILRGFKKPDAAYVERDRGTAIRRAIEAAGKDDVVLIAGKGHEEFQLVAGKRIPFNDRECALQVLREGRA